jgi:hypothetical protein
VVVKINGTSEWALCETLSIVHELEYLSNGGLNQSDLKQRQTDLFLVEHWGLYVKNKMFREGLTSSVLLDEEE